MRKCVCIICSHVCVFICQCLCVSEHGKGCVFTIFMNVFIAMYCIDSVFICSFKFEIGRASCRERV